MAVRGLFLVLFVSVSDAGDPLPSLFYYFSWPFLFPCKGWSAFAIT